MDEKKSILGNRLFLIDGHALAYKSHFAFQRNPLSDAKGRNISAVYGFFSTLFSLIEKEKPEYLAIAFDTKAPTFRHQIFGEYKATRQKMPPDMMEQLPILRSALEASGIALFEQEGFEADDLIGTLAKKAEADGLEVFIFTGDKDFFQLVSDKIKIYNLRKGTTDPEILGADEVKAKFGVPPEKVIEVLALMGDSSDNVPGIRGVGEKTAVDLIEQYGSMEAVLEHRSELKGTLKDKVENGVDSARLSHGLVIIKTDCPVDFNPDKLRLKIDDSALREKFQELQFFSFMKYLKDTASAEKREVLHYHTVDSPEKLADLISKLNSCATFAFDTETTSQNPMEAKLVGMSFSFKEGEAYYIPCNGFHWDILPEVSDRFSFYGEDAGNNTSYILSKLKPLMENPGLFKTGQNAKYDIIVLKNYGVEVKGLVFDTMVSHYLLEPNARGHNLDAMSLKYLKLKKIPTSDLIGSGAKQITMDKVPVAMVSKYACEDADCAFRLTGILKREIPEKLLEKLFNEVELPLIAVLAVLERNGVAIDTLLLARMSDEIAEQLRQLEKRIHLLAGREFNINSPRQLSEILFEKLNLPVIRKTKTGLSTDEATLKKLSPQDPLPAEILNYRTLAKLKNTYTDALPQMINPHTGRIHTSYNQTVAATGRLSSSDPNLQNIPIRTELGGRIRAAFVAGKAGWKILSADYSQIELRILAHLSGDERLIDAFIKGEDIHQRTASLIFNCPLEVVSKEMRRSAKEVNFGVIYGMRDFGLSERLGIPRGRAKEFIDNYFNSYPKVLEFIEETIRKAKEKEIVSTMLGRIRPLPEINSSNHNIRQNAERIAVNTPIQGSAADLIKIAMINIQRRMLREKVDAMMIMQVHDELVFEVPESEMEAMQALVVEEMEGAMKLSLPLKAEASFADNWLEAH